MTFASVVYELTRQVCEVAIPEGEIQNQLNKLYRRMFRGTAFAKEEHQNFTTYVVVTRVQKRWRHLCRSKELVRRSHFKAARDALPHPEDVMAVRNATEASCGRVLQLAVLIAGLDVLAVLRSLLLGYP